MDKTYKVAMNKAQFPGVRHIYTVRCADLAPNLTLQAICGYEVAINAPMKLVNHSGRAKLTREGAKINGVMSETSTLEFSTADVLPEQEHIAFVVSCANGENYLIGAREPIYPSISYTQTTGDVDGETPLRSYKIAHTAQRSAITCII